MDRRRAIERLSEVAREQAGYVTAAQAKQLDVDGDTLVRMAKRGDLRRVSRGVYAFAGSFPGPRENVIAAWLRLIGDRMPWDQSNPKAVISHASAAAIHGFGTFVPASPTFTVAQRRFQPPDESIRLYTAKLAPVDWRWVVLPEGVSVPVTTPARTVVDLAFAGEERSQVVDALTEARENGLLDDQGVVDAVDRRQARRGRGSAAWLGEVVANQ
jgi:predicted transcriptional regulator of viral defense system